MSQKLETDTNNPANAQHLCAKNVVHEEWGAGTCIPTMHADPDENGLVEWYDVMFEHGLQEKVMVSELKVTKAEQHMHASKKMKKEDASNDEEDDGEGLDKVDPKAAKKKFKDRKDKDIDNDGDTDDSDEYLHKKRKAIGKAMESYTAAISKSMAQK